MRHVRTESHNYIDDAANKPYSMEYTFKSISPNRRYVKVLEFVEKNPGCKRSDILLGVWRSRKRGSNSTLFSQMLYADLIDYNSKFEYRVTRKGKGILKKIEKRG